RGAGGRGGGLVDQRPWQTAEALAPLATSSEEKRMAHEAERLADHEVDQAFAMALRLAALDRRTLTGNALTLQQNVAEMKEMVKEDQAKVDSLTASLKGANGVVAQSDDLDLAKAQLQLESDELDDATDNLARMSGDKRGQIQQELTAREAAMKKFDEGTDGAAQPAVVSTKRYRTLAGRVGAWFDQRSRMDLIVQAQAEADTDVAALTKQQGEIEQRANAASEAVDSPEVAAEDGSIAVKGRVARMAQAHALAKVHSILEDRVETQKQLSAVYGRWHAQVQLQHRIVRHMILVSLAWIAFMVLFAALLGTAIEAMLARLTIDKRSLQTMRTIVSLGIQVVTLLLVLLAIFGTPSQMPTILGLATAGLTVVFQDFILAFFGWFVLMGKNGIRVGDWVEINGVGGEVVDIGLFRTTLLETGNWTDKGHPTGRRVTFVNKFAISGQYFNFSTSGQWMWDEISVTIPPGEDTYKMIDAIHTAVVKETEKDAGLAEEEWHRATQQHGLSQFSAVPSVDMRPAGAGIDIIVRYVTRAADRFEMRNRLYEAVIALLHQPDAAIGAGKS
ncbi:MAG: mechanosensitive ion channel domain-containing protein, partial [Edaphobacter sp.]